MAALNSTTVMDSSEHVVVTITMRNAGSATTPIIIADASTLVNHDTEPLLYLEEVQWSINAAATGGVALYYNASTNQEIVTMTPGNGHFGGESLSALQKPNPDATGFDGDIYVSVNPADGFLGSGSAISVVNGTIIAKFAKISGYRD
tara:strand:+ start:286 stop:726 length:441 start_codon:yes stop_codon:yes gene_type:complete